MSIYTHISISIYLYISMSISISISFYVYLCVVYFCIYIHIFVERERESIYGVLGASWRWSHEGRVAVLGARGLRPRDPPALQRRPPEVVV